MHDPSSSQLGITSNQSDPSANKFYQIVALQRTALEDNLPTQLTEPALKVLGEHIKKFRVHIEFTSGEVATAQALKSLELLLRIIQTLSSRSSSVESMVLKMNIRQDLFNPTSIDLIALQKIQRVYRESLFSMRTLSRLTSLEIDVSSLLSTREADLAEVIGNLPELEKFRAIASSQNTVTDLDALKLGSALASRTELRVLALKALTSPRNGWAQLDWKGTLEILELESCRLIENRGLIRWLSRFKSLKKLKIVHQSIKPMGNLFFSMTQNDFLNSLQQFCFCGWGPNLAILPQLSCLPKLEKLCFEWTDRSLSSAPSSNLNPHTSPFYVSAFKTLAVQNSLAWPCLKEIMFHNTDPDPSDQEWLTSYATDRKLSVQILTSAFNNRSLYETEDIDSYGINHTEPIEYDLISGNCRTKAQSSSDHRNILMTDVKLPELPFSFSDRRNESIDKEQMDESEVEEEEEEEEVDHDDDLESEISGLSFESDFENLSDDQGLEGLRAFDEDEKPESVSESDESNSDTSDSELDSKLRDTRQTRHKETGFLTF